MPGLTTIETAGRLGNFPYRSGDESVVVKKPARTKAAPPPPNKPPRPPRKTRTGGKDERWSGDADNWRFKEEKNKKLATKQGFNKERKKPY